MYLTYSQARKMFNTGDVVFFEQSTTGVHPVSSMVAFFTRSRVVHVGIACWATIGDKRRLMLVEAQGGARRRVVNLSFYQDRTMHVIPSQRPLGDYLDTAVNRLGQVRYGYLDACYIGLREVLKNIVVLPRKNFSGEICTEFVSTMMGFDVPPLSPHSLMEYMLLNNHHIKMVVCP